MSAKGFSCISSTRASPSTPRVRRTRRSVFRAFFRGLLGAAVPVAFPDIRRLFVRIRDVPCKCPLTTEELHPRVRDMTDDRKSGLALIAGSVGLIITMALHPVGHDLLVPGQFDRIARLVVAVHTLALVCIPVMFLGAMGLSRRLASPDRLSLCAVVAYGF